MMTVLVFTDGKAATLVAKGSPDEQGMRELPHMQCIAWRVCETLDEGIEWFRGWCAINL
jgi:hypothetical protein